MELFTARLGAAVTMEHDVLDMLQDGARRARRPDVRRLLGDHVDETIEHIATLGSVYGILGLDPEARPCPAVEALKLERAATVKLTGEQLLDDVILAAATEAEHHEIAVYDELVAYAEGMDREDLAAFLRRSLEQEQRALEAQKTAARDVARQTLQPA